MKLAFGSDHAGYALKEALIKHAQELGHETIDCGTNSTESCDYPIFGHRVGNMVADGSAERGILVCGSGIGIGIAANKIPGIRCATVRDAYDAEMCRKHNNANVLALGERTTDEKLALELFDAYMSTEFEGGRHARRVDLIEVKQE